MFSLVGLQAKLAVLGAALLSFFALWVRLQIVTRSRDRAVVVAETLTARHHTIKIQQKIKREEKKKLVSLKADIREEIDKSEEDFKGLDNLNKPNKF